MPGGSHGNRPSCSAPTQTAHSAAEPAEQLRAALHTAADAIAEMLIDRTPPAIAAADESNGPLLGVRASAELLGLSTSALRRCERNGSLPAVRIGRRVLFRREQLM